MTVGVRVVVFDIDDTLYLERDYARSGFRAVDEWVRVALGVGGFAEQAWAAFESGVRGTIFDTALTALGVVPSPDTVAEMVGRYRRHEPDIVLLDDARACLDRVGDGAHDRSALGVAVVTDGPLASQRAKARRLGLDGWTREIVFTEALGPGLGKPHPAAFELVERHLGASGDACVYVADNPAKDFGAPRRLGWRTVRVRRSLGLHADRPSGDDIDHEIADLDGLEPLLAQ